MHSISTSTPLGSCFTATQLRAGLWTNHLAYSSFMLCGTPRPFSASGTTTPPLAAGVCTHGKVGHVGQEDVDLDHLLDRRAGLLEDGLEVADAGRRLLLDRALDQVALGVAGDLARAVDGAGRLDGLGLVAGGQSVSQSVSQSASQPASQPHCTGNVDINRTSRPSTRHRYLCIWCGHVRKGQQLGTHARHVHVSNSDVKPQ